VCLLTGERNPGVQTDLWCRFDGPSVIGPTQKSYLRAIDVHADGGSALHPSRHMLRTKANHFTQIALLEYKVKEKGHLAQFVRVSVAYH
jgi:hypothetical protein